MRWLCSLLLGGSVAWGAQTAFFPLRDVRPGMKGVGKTVFSGTRVDEFQVEILGVLDNIGPKQSLILAKLSGGPLAETGVMQGMSGSPVYIDGKLLGAVAMGFPFSKQPIAGIRPIEDMLRVTGETAPRRALAALWDGELAKALPPPEDVLAGGGRLRDIATPVSFGGFTRAAIEHFAPQLRSLGLEPQQGMAAGGVLPPQMGSPASLQPGSMISVQLLSGDLSIGADGTVTYIDGNRVYAFGHRFLATGSTDLPFARAEVLTLLPNLASSFKISAPREWMGSMTQDRSVAVAGRLGRRAQTVPVSISVARHSAANKPGPVSSYRVQMVNDRVLSPFLLQIAVFSALDATERLVGESSFAVSGEVEFENGTAPLKLKNMYAGDINLPAQVSLATAVPLAYVMQSGFESLQLKRVALNIDSFPQKRQLQIDQLWSSRREVRPGDSFEITVVLSGDNGAEYTRKATYHVPVGAPPGPIQITAADANTMNLTEFRQLISTAPKSPAQLISFMNSLRVNTKAYLRLWRAETAYEVQGETLPDPPPSLGMILARSSASLTAIPPAANSKMAEFEVSAGEMVITGSKTIQVDVKE